MKIEIINYQKIKRLNRKTITHFIESVLKACDVKVDKILFIFCDDRFIVKLNKKFFHRSVPTDVIAFPLDNVNLGEVVVSVERAVKVCGQYNNSWHAEFSLYIIHGILHLLGYSDISLAKKKIMFKKQDEIFKKVYDCAG